MATEGPARRRKRRASDAPVRGVVGEIRIEAGSAFSPRSRLAVRALNVPLERENEKEKVSLTLDHGLVGELRALDGSLSATVNDLLHTAIAQQRLETLLDELEAEAGPAPSDALDRVLEQWLGDDES